MKNPKFSIAVLIFSFFILHLNCFAADQLTITTYYPSPYGVYKTLRIYPTNDATCAVSLACNKGEFCYSSTTDQLFACGSTAQWAAMGGGGGAGGWTDDGTAVRLTTITDTVGVGTITPASKLDVVTTDAGIRAINASSQSGYGIYGYSRDNIAIFAESLNSHGVYGTASGGAGSGVLGRNTTGGKPGVEGNSFGPAAGVYGVSTGGEGVMGLSSASDGKGVYGRADAGYGVYGQGGTWAGYFVGNVYISGNVGIGTADPRKKLEVSGGDVYINQTSGKLIMKSPDGTCSSCGPSNFDMWSCVSVVCP